MLRRGALLGLAAAGALCVTPGVAQAKTFKANFEDPSGDANPDARDIVHARVAYNRKSGAISVSVRVAADYAEEREDAVVVVLISDLVKGRCYKPIMSVVGLLSDPAVPVGVGAAKSKKSYPGRGAIDGDTYNMRVKAKGLSGRTPGCVAAAILTTDSSAKIVDETAEDNGFA